MEPLDKLTRLHTAERLQEQLGREIRRARRYGRELSLVGLSFELPPEGRAQLYPLLKLAASWVRGCTRTIDLAVRAGEAIWLLLPETGPEGAKALAHKLRSEIEQQVRRSTTLGGAEVSVRTAAASFPADAEEGRALLQRLREQLDGP